MKVLEGIRLALSQLRAQKLKSFFSLLGVIIGVMFLIVVVSVVEGMDRYIREDFSSQLFGVNTVTVRRSPRVRINTTPQQRRFWARAPRFTYRDAEWLRERVSTPALIAEESFGSGEMEAEDGRTVENVQIFGASPEVFEIRNWVVERGRPFSPQEADRGTPVVVLGVGTADALFDGGDPLGRNVKIRGFPYRVVGVLEEQGSVLGQSLDNRAIAPARSPVQSFTAPRGFVDQITLKAPGPELVPALHAEVEELLRVRRGLRPAQPNDFAVETADESLSFWDRISRILFLALPGLVAISLVVGGVVIMNIMLVSVMERTREIGVRKAIGARRRDILVQVMIESATLSGLGAIVGVLVGIGLTFLVRVSSPLPAAVAPRWVSLGVALGVVVGMIAGVYPAARASRLDPVDALRYE